MTDSQTRVIVEQTPGVQVTIRLDADVLAYFQWLAGNDNRTSDYQTWINVVLRNFMERDRSKDTDGNEVKAPGASDV